MVSVITGDIIKSRKYRTPEVWLVPLKEAFSKMDISAKHWEIFRGDSFQLEIENNQKAFYIAVYIKACIKTIQGLDVRMAIGVGNKDFEGDKISESNGEAFVFSGETFEELKQEKINLKIKTPYLSLNEELNLYFKLALIAMDHWTVNSSQAVKIAMENLGSIQSEIAEIIGISQDAVSKRLKRAYYNDIMSLDRMYYDKITLLELNLRENRS